MPVDLFPHSLGFELVILFERVSAGEVDKYANLAAAPQTIKDEDIHDPGSSVLDTAEDTLADNGDVKLEAQTVKKEQITWIP